MNALLGVCIAADRQVHLAKDVPTEEVVLPLDGHPKTFRSVINY